MPVDDVRIRRLPANVAKQIESSVSITSLNEVVVELVKNSLDAGARSISVTIDYLRGGCVVQDDGHGIPAEYFKEGAGLGHPHHTSKYNSMDQTHGYRGCFLASLAALSLLTITSRHALDSISSSIVFHWARVISRLSPAPSHQELDNCHHGTRVVVNNLFGNMPVRVKTRALAQQRSADVERQWEGLKRLLIPLVLVGQHSFKFKVIESTKNRQLNFRANPRLEKWVDCAREDLDIQHVCSTLAHAGQIPFNDDKSWTALSAHTPDVVMRAAISLEPSPVKHCQFISIGVRPVSPQQDIHGLYDEVNRLFDASNFGRIELDNEAAALSRVSSLASPRKRKILTAKINSRGINRWPKFFLHIQPTKKSLSIGNETQESGLGSTGLLNMLEAMIIQFLEEHHLKPQAQKQQKVADHPVSASRSGPDRLHRTSKPQAFSNEDAKEVFESNIKILPSHLKNAVSKYRDFTHWTRTKSGRSLLLEDIVHGPKTRTSQSGQWSDLSQPKVQVSASGDLGACGQIDSSSNPSDKTVWLKQEAERVAWTDPSTNARLLINSRTGQSYDTLSPQSGTRLERPRSAESIFQQRRVSVPRPRSAVTDPGSSWLASTLGSWENPAFTRSERAILSLRNAVSNTENVGRFQDYSCFTFNDVNITRFAGRFSRVDLLTAEVLAQIDKKYILVRIGDSLALVDQHAADERCRIEELFARLFVKDSNGVTIVQSTQLSEPVTIPIASNEISLFKASQKRFELWGCSYSISKNKETREAAALITALPTLIFERCRTDIGLIKEIIREDIWMRQESAASSLSTADKDLVPEWVQQIASCPKGIVELLNSRACRSAIMFNDPLSITDCESIVNRLSNCVFPFQCAHGRPSMIPLLTMNASLDAQNNSVVDRSSQALPFSEAFKAWSTD